MSAADLIFAIFALVTAGAAVAAVTTTVEGRAVWWLAAAIAGLSGGLVVLQTPAVGLGYLILHLGGVAVVLATVVRAAPTGRASASSPDARTEPATAGGRLAAGLVATVSAGLLCAGLLAGFGTEVVDGLPNRDDAWPIGGQIFGAWWLPLTLVAATVAAGVVGLVVLISGRREDR